MLSWPFSPMCKHCIGCVVTTWLLYLRLTSAELRPPFFRWMQFLSPSPDSEKAFTSIDKMNSLKSTLTLPEWFKQTRCNQCWRNWLCKPNFLRRGVPQLQRSKGEFPISFWRDKGTLRRVLPEDVGSGQAHIYRVQVNRRCIQELDLVNLCPTGSQCCVARMLCGQSAHFQCEKTELERNV